MSPLPPRILHPLLDLPGIQHGFFTRQGGVSGGVYDSLNIGLGSKDAPDAVQENRRRVAASFGRPADHLLSLYQIHSATALEVSGPWQQERPEADGPKNYRPEADGLVTTTPGLILSALSADCAPLLFADPNALVVGACHAGWKGALYGMIETTIALMIEKGATLANLRCVVGPCIAQVSYEVGADYAETFAAHDRDSLSFFAAGSAADKRQFDLPGYCLMRLRRAGLTQIAATGHDTCADEALFFSNRRNFKQGLPDYGRLISAIALRA